jgi:hypothetical protein
VAWEKVLVSPQCINLVSWADSKVYVDLTRETIQNGPAWSDSVPSLASTNIGFTINTPGRLIGCQYLTNIAVWRAKVD